MPAVAMRRSFTHRSFALVLLGALCFSGCRRRSNETPMDKSTPTGNSAAEDPRIATLRAAYGAFNRNDIDSAVAAMDANIEWSEPPEFSGGGAYHGRNAVKGYLTQSRAAWAEGASEPEQFIPSGDRIAVFVHARFRLKGKDDWQEVSLADVYTFRDG